ncbi:MAG: hypothetical protein N2053_10765 [Chitinispirillaceae bacterium]|nr:hypothetical protein [Chitinispirillaceae bacterium]
MEELKKIVENYTNEELLDQFINHKEEYTPEALSILEEEIKKRNLEINQEKVQEEKKWRELSFDSKDFVPFEHRFRRPELEIAISILRENKIIFYVDNNYGNSVIPIVSEAAIEFIIYVHKDFIEKAHQLLDDIFEKKEGKYKLKTENFKDKLKAFSFSDITLTEKEAEESVKISLTEEEKSVIKQYAERLLKEADYIEQEKGKVIFFYDSLEEIIRLLSSAGEEIEFKMTELLALLEILQVYCDEPDFPSFLEEATNMLLGFFLSKE